MAYFRRKYIKTVQMCWKSALKTRTDFHYFTWGFGGGGGGGGGGVWTNHGGGGVICSLITGSREFFPDIGLLARRNFAHTIQDLL